ncbi:MAG: glycosyltransferase family 39 protein [Planctomycetales bacterium]
MEVSNGVESSKKDPQPEATWHKVLDKRWLLLVILIASFLAKAGTRCALVGESDYWRSGYGFYYRMADDYLRENEIYLSSHGEKYYAFRPPVYPLLIAGVCRLSGHSPFAFIVIQALISTITVAMVYFIAMWIAGRRAGLLSAALFACYPYAFLHDTQLQETGLYACLSTSAIACILLALEKKKRWPFFLSGLLLGIAVLTRISHLLGAGMIGLLVLWLLRREKRQAVQLAGAMTLGALLVLSPWLIRNKLKTGHLALTSESGFALARAHNEYTFQYYPWRSIDLGWKDFHNQMDGRQREEIDSLRSDEFALGR